MQYTFERYEKKFLLCEEQYERFMAIAGTRIAADAYGKTTVLSVYLDTPDHRLIRASLDKPVYKEKLRVRSYGVPKAGDMVFVELKKKYRGVVYKRRVCLSLTEARDWLLDGAVRRTGRFAARLTTPCTTIPASPRSCLSAPSALPTPAWRIRFCASHLTGAYATAMRNCSWKRARGGRICYRQGSACWK